MHDHQHYHGSQRAKNNPEWFERFHTNGIAKAPEWHKSSEGHKWHLKHFEETKDKLWFKKEFICENCGKVFIAQNNGHNRFCSNICKSRWRREHHLDDVERVCVICGNKFKVNKYSKAKTCSKQCASTFGYRKKKQNQIN